MQISKRLISLILVFVFVVALVPMVTIYAAPKTVTQIKTEYSPYQGNPVSNAAQLRTALQQVDNKQYIEIDANIVLPSELKFTRNIDIAIIGNGTRTRLITLATDVEARHLVVDAPGLAKISFADIELIGSYDQIGGGIITTNDLTLDGVVIKDCRWDGNGAAVSANGGTYVTLYNSTITDNYTATYSASHGGAIYAGHVSVTDSVISNNKTTTANSFGGGIYAINSLTLNNVTMEENESNSGAAAYCEGNISATNSKINDNNASINGGGLYSHNGSVSINGESKISGNTATDGAGIYAANSVEVSGNTTISNNTAGIATVPGNPGKLGNGGGIYAKNNVTLNSGVVVISNTATNTGGGICALNGNTTVNTGAKVQKNTAKIGGGIWTKTASSAGISGAIAGEISENKATDGEGGGIYAAGDVKVNSGALITKNEAKTFGGGIYSTATVTANGGTISANKAETGGAGINTMNALINGGTITLNTTPANGGGLRSVDTGGLITVAGGEISANEAVDGGGIWTANDLNGTAGKIINNKATGNGAGIHGSNHTLAIDISGTEISGNIAAGDGGGIYVYSSSVALSGTSKINNNKAVNGGGVYGAEGATLAFNGGEIKGNTASADGGGVHISYRGDFTMESGAEFSGNKSAQGYYWDITKTEIFGEKDHEEDYYLKHKALVKDATFTSPYNNAYNNDDVNFSGEPCIEYRANGGTGTMPTHVWSWDKGATIAECQFTAPEGKVFDRWDTYQWGTGEKYKPGQVIENKVTGRLVLFAIWKNDGSSPGGGGGGGGGGNDSKKPDENVTAPLTVTAVANGKTIYEVATIEKIGSLMVVAPKLLGYEVNGGGEQSVQIKDEENKLVFEYNQIADVVLELKDHIKYVNGYPDGTFKPDDTITRAEAAAIFYRLVANEDKGDAGAARFGDVKESDWYAQAINYLAKNGIIQGYSDGSFKPNQTISRAEFAAIATRFDKLSDSGINSFSDVPYTHWAMEYINTAAEKGWVTGFPGGIFKPDDVVTRAQVVAVVNRMLGRKVDAADVPGTAEQYTDVPDTYWGYADVMEAAIEHESNSRKANGSEVWAE